MMEIILDRVKPLQAVAILVCFSVALTNCGSSSSSSVEDTATRSCSETLDVAIHEHSLYDNANLCASSDKVVVVEFEHENAEQHDQDSGEAGVDVIPYKIENDGAYTFRFEDDDNNPHYAMMKDSSGNQVFRIEANGEAVSMDLQAGSYNLFLYHAGSKTVSLFIQPDSASASRSNGETLFSEADLKKLLSTDSCKGCDLRDADLSHANLNSANLRRAQLWNADLTGADLGYAELDGANLFEANLTGANLYQVDMDGASSLTSANLTNANLTNANLNGVDIRYANLTNANLTNAFLIGADLKYANLTRANLTGSDLTGADLYSATWTDGKKICATGSIGVCK